VPPQPRGEIQTPFGALRITVEGGYTTVAELADFVTINRMLCKVTINSSLNTRHEDWMHRVYVQRVTVADPPSAYKPYTITGDATPNANRKVRHGILPLLEAWLEEHSAILEEGKQAADRALILKAHHRLDAIVEAVEKRRAELDDISRYLTERGTLSDDHRRLLNDLWSHHWRF